MAYDEYSSLTSKHKIQTSSTGVAALGASTKVWGREVAINSWERLIQCELLIPAGTGGTLTSGRDVGREVKMWKLDVALEEIPGSVEGLSGIMSKWCREI
jgi:origin recognition complex subunit 4